MAGILQNFLGGGTKPETQGRRSVSGGDRDAASRDTVARKPAAKKAESPKKKAPSGGGGGSKPKVSGGGSLPQTVPVPPMRSQPGPFPPRPEGDPSQLALPPQAPVPQANPLMPQMPPRPEGPVGDNTGPNPGPYLGRPDAPVNPMPFGGGPYPPRPEGPALPQPFGGGPYPPRPEGPVTDNTGNAVPSLNAQVPGPGRAELAGLLAGGSQRGPTMGSPMPGQDGMGDWLRRLLGGGAQ